MNKSFYSFELQNSFRQNLSSDNFDRSKILFVDVTYSMVNFSLSTFLMQSEKYFELFLFDFP
nr:hypothetical protein [Dinophyceae sp. MRD-151]